MSYVDAIEMRRPRDVVRQPDMLIDGADLDEEIRWEGAMTTPENYADWRDAGGDTIVQELRTYLPILMARSHSIAKNPVIAGALNTASEHISAGFALQCVAKDPRQLENPGMADQFREWSCQAEMVLQEFWESPSIYDDETGVELLKQLVRQDHTAGNSFLEIVPTNEGVGSPIPLRLHSIHPNRCFQHVYASPADGNHTLFGLELDSWGRAVNYHFRVRVSSDIQNYKVESRDKRRVIHIFDRLESDMPCGIPRLSTLLPGVKKLDKFENATLRAATLAARAPLSIERIPNTDGKAVRIASNKLMKIGDALQPPEGYRANALDQKHPTAQYDSFTAGKQRDNLRGINQPRTLMDSSKSSYSAMRADYQLWNRSVGCSQQLIHNRLKRFNKRLLREAALMRLIPDPPVAYDLVGVFEEMPSVDPQKQARGDQLAIDSLQTTPLELAAKRGVRPHEWTSRIQKQIDALNDVSPEAGDQWFASKIGAASPAKSADIEQVVADAVAAALEEQGAM